MEGYFISYSSEAIILFLVGAFAGSFLNVVALSLPSIEKAFLRRSACPKCKQELKWYELIPLVSYLIQLGRCRSCKKSIASSYLWVEVGCGAMLLLTYIALWSQLLWWQLLLVLIILSFWLIIFLHDARTMYVPMEMVTIASVLALIFQWTNGLDTLLQALLAALYAFVFLYTLKVVASWMAKQEAMGSADAFVGAMIALLVNKPSIYAALFLSFIFGAVLGLLAIYSQKKFEKYKKVAFAPALILGGLVALLWGPQMISWYLGYTL